MIQPVSQGLCCVSAVTLTTNGSDGLSQETSTMFVSKSYDHLGTLSLFLKVAMTTLLWPPCSASVTLFCLPNPQSGNALPLSYKNLFPTSTVDLLTPAFRETAWVLEEKAALINLVVLIWIGGLSPCISGVNATTCVHYSQESPNLSTWLPTMYTAKPLLSSCSLGTKPWPVKIVECLLKRDTTASP